jgi:hypothetical protein
MTPRAQQRAAWRSRFRGKAVPTAGQPLAPQPFAPAPLPPTSVSAALRPAVRPGVSVRIDELALRGFDSHAAPRIAASMEHEMQRLIGGALPSRWRTASAIEVLDARVRLHSMRDAAAIGEELARAVLTAQREDRA